MRTTMVALPLAFLATVAACGDDTEATTSTTTTTTAGAGGAATATTGSTSTTASTSGAGGGSTGAGGMTVVPPGSPTLCADKTAAIVAATGTTITVSPAGDGQVMANGQTTTLRSVVSNASDGDTILLEDGTYTLPEAGSGNFTGLYFTTPNVTLRSASGNAAAVIIDSAYRVHGGQSGAITIDAPGVVLANFTVQRSIFHLIHLWADGDDAVIHDVHMVDGGQQFLKSSPGGGQNVDDVEVSCSQFRMTDQGRDNVWGYGASDGSTACYTGGIDTHDARDWHIHDSYFSGIYCTTGTPHPVHGQASDARNNMTYVGGLAEHAIHMWDSESGSSHIIERNHIINCARGIGLGLQSDVYGGVIRNNMVFSSFAGGGEHDVGIIVERGQGTKVLNNTVFFSNPSAYENRIEYRWDVSTNVEIRNNLTNGLIRSRNNADATLEANVDDATAAAFEDATAGDLHLSSCDVAGVTGAGASLSDVVDDFDGETRPSAPDIGADQCAP